MINIEPPSTLSISVAAMPSNGKPGSMRFLKHACLGWVGLRDMKFYLDGKLVAERTPADLQAGSAWIYDHPFFMILNVAVGADWPGNPNETTTLPQRMLVDYVRVYARDQNATWHPMNRSKAN
jgi:hypothetical protein